MPTDGDLSLTGNLTDGRANPVADAAALDEMPGSDGQSPATGGDETTALENAPEPAAEDASEPSLAHPLAQDLLLNPSSWALWPAVAVLRWLLHSHQQRGLLYRSWPSLAFPTGEIHDVGIDDEFVQLTVTAPGIASPGSALPTADIARIIRDMHPPGRGALAAWLDGPGDRFLQALESAKARFSASFSLATGRGTHGQRHAAKLSGSTAPLGALPEHRLHGFMPEPNGAVALGTYFVSAPSAHGLADCIRAFTGLPVRIKEFTGARVRNIRPARLGAPMLRMLGVYCDQPAAGVEVILEGGDNAGARRWAADPTRILSLRLLCERYVGNDSVTAHIFLALAAGNTEPATLGTSFLGGMAVLGAPEAPVLLPLRMR